MSDSFSLMINFGDSRIGFAASIATNNSDDHETESAINFYDKIREDGKRLFPLMGISCLILDQSASIATR